MKLVLAEKHSVAQSIAKVLGATKREDGYLQGNGYIVSWCVGHLVELAKPEAYDERYGKWTYADLPILPDDWKYEVSAGTRKQFGILKKLMAREDVASLVCATDAGREGELIFRLVYHQAGCRKPFERLWISSMEDSAIRDGFETSALELNTTLCMKQPCAESEPTGLSASTLGCLCVGLLFNDQFGAALRVMGLPVDWCVFLHALGLCLAFWSIYELGCYLWQEHKLPLRLEKLTLKGSAAEAEITPDSQQHCLDLYNFEMVHILEQIAGRHGNTVVFEDMERFESEICVATMTKLWELNKLLNTHLQTLDPDAKPVRFVYAISDKVLNAENRVKYFDVVLPVLPSLNYCNFIPLFRAELNKMGYNDIDDRSNSISPVIEILNRYLTDHRQMLSTLNEFSLLCDLFRANADTEVGNEEATWLLAFAACKTLYPEYCYSIFSKKMSDELPAAPADSMIQELIENNWLTKTNLQRIVYPWNHICDQWIVELKRGIKQKRHRVVEKLQKQIHDNEGEAKIGRLEDIRNRRDFQQLLLDAPSPYFADEVKKIVGLDGIIEFGYEWILDRINELSGANAFCSCMYLLAQDEERSKMSVDEKEKIGQWCRTQLDAPNFSLSGSWRFQENVDIVKKVAAEILIDPNDNELLEKIATLTLTFPAGASSSK